MHRRTLSAVASAAIVIAGIALAVLATGCTTLTPNSIRAEAQHSSHNWGSPPYDYGYDYYGVGAQWKLGGLMLDASQLVREAKDGEHNYTVVKGVYTIPLK